MKRALALACLLATAGPAAGAPTPAYDLPQVVGGQIVSPGQFPWLVRIVSTEGVVCTGNLISDDWVLTAAHCGEPERVYITDAMPPALGPDHFVWWIAPAQWIPHPGFDPAASPIDFKDDIALIQLSLNASDFPPEVAGVPVYIPESIGLATSPPNTSSPIGNMTIAGFGFTSVGSSDLPAAAEWAQNIPTVSASTCLFPTTPQKDLCYGTFPNNCPGDSGGAVFRHDDGAYSQYGVVSIVTAVCGTGNSRATYVPGYVNWINNKMSQYNSNKITMEWELPKSIKDDEVATGVSNGQGWVFSSAGAIESVELYVNGKKEETFPCCSRRGDVPLVHPTAPDETGFSGAVSWPRFGVGNHQMMLKVTDTAGNKKTEVRTIKVVQILPGVNFVRDLSAEDAVCFFNSHDSFSCTGLTAKVGECEGAVEFRWSNGKQAFEAYQGCEE